MSSLTGKALARCHNHSRHDRRRDLPVSVETTTAKQRSRGNYHKHVHLQSLRRSAEACSSLWQRTESSAFSVTIHHGVVARGDKLESLHFSLDAFVESSSGSPRENLSWFAFTPNVLSANTTYFPAEDHVPSQLLFQFGVAAGCSITTDIKFDLQNNKKKEQKLRERLECIFSSWLLWKQSQPIICLHLSLHSSNPILPH